MSFPQRLLIFFVGVLLGGLLSLYIIKQRGFERPGPPPQSLEEAEAEAIPGILKAYGERQEPMESRFIVDEFRERGSEAGEIRRVFILEGQMPGQLLRIEEWQTRGPYGRQQVNRWRVSAAARARIQLQPGTPPGSVRDLLDSHGARLLRRSDEPDTYVISITNSGARSVDNLIQALESTDEPILNVTPDYLDKPSVSP